jgi:hypothetical protein
MDNVKGRLESRDHVVILEYRAAHGEAQQVGLSLAPASILIGPQFSSPDGQGKRIYDAKSYDMLPTSKNGSICY